MREKEGTLIYKYNFLLTCLHELEEDLYKCKIGEKTFYCHLDGRRRDEKLGYHVMQTTCDWSLLFGTSSCGNRYDDEVVKKSSDKVICSHCVLDWMVLCKRVRVLVNG
jgi:hypothetical protein